LSKISRQIRKDMKFTERIKQVCEECQMPQQQFAAVLETDTAACCKTGKANDVSKPTGYGSGGIRT
jgi:hypothetical protein